MAIIQWPRHLDSVSHVVDVPSVIAQVSIPGTVHWVEVGGEPLTRAALESVAEGTALYNAYGPTEVTIASVGKVVVRHGAVRLASIGKPLANVTCYVLDVESSTLQPIGVWGELLLGGVQVARGYGARPEKTAESFVADPWADSRPSGRGVLYRTGDRVRWYADGELEFGGRIDFQVRRRAPRVCLPPTAPCTERVDDSLTLTNRPLSQPPHSAQAPSPCARCDESRQSLPPLSPNRIPARR